MSSVISLLPLWAFMACYKVNYTFTLYFHSGTTRFESHQERSVFLVVQYFQEHVDVALCNKSVSFANHYKIPSSLLI